MARGIYLGLPVQVVSLRDIVQALKEEGLEKVYLVLERLFHTEPFVVVNAEGRVVFAPFEEEEIFSFLELVSKKFLTFDEEVSYERD